VSTCLVCGPKPEHASVLDGAVRRCATCGFGWTVGEPAAPGELRDDTYPGGREDEDPLTLRRRRFEASRRLRWVLSMVRPASLVEVGSAGGFFVEAARRLGIDASGIEASPAAARFARERLRVPVVEGSFPAFSPARQVDAVCAFDVLGQVEDPRVFLAAAREALGPGGWLVLEVPNFASPGATSAGATSAGAVRRAAGLARQQPEQQRWHFTPESLMRLVMRCGFHIVRHDTAVVRYYLPARYRWRHAHRLLPADWAGTGSLRRTHPRLGDLLRVVARLPRDGRRHR
jgi:SAM-dependent methyltransferase